MKNLKSLALALLLSAGVASAHTLMVNVEACKDDCTKTMKMEMCDEVGSKQECTFDQDECPVTIVAEVCKDECVKVSLKCDGHDNVDPMDAQIDGKPACFKCKKTGDCVTVTVTKCCDEAK